MDAELVRTSRMSDAQARVRRRMREHLRAMESAPVATMDDVRLLEELEEELRALAAMRVARHVGVRAAVAR